MTLLDIEEMDTMIKLDKAMAWLKDIENIESNLLAIHGYGMSSSAIERSQNRLCNAKVAFTVLEVVKKDWYKQMLQERAKNRRSKYEEKGGC